MVRMAKTAISILMTLVFSISACTVSFAWESVGTANPVTNSTTHVFLVDNALKILENDLGTTVTSNPDYQILKQYIGRLESGAVAPDNLSNVVVGGLTENDWWSSHFYDADTGGSYSASVPYINAEYQTRRYFRMAVADFRNGSYSDGVYKLGYASHFLADLCNPHHAANNTALGSPYNHGDFETFTQANHHNYAVTTVAESGTTAAAVYSGVNGYNTADSFITAKANDYGKAAKNYFYSSCNPGNTDSWNIAASATVGNSQKVLAQLYYRFLSELKNSQKLSIRVKTENVLWAGTDDDIYFGMQTKSGITKEFLLDKTCDMLGGVYGINIYNDFEQNSDDTYTFYVNDSQFNFSDVANCWLRKDEYISVANDWMVNSVEVKLNDQFVSSRYLSKWLNGDVTERWGVNGLIPGNTIGSFSVTIKTADVLWAGTDDDIYFGMSLDNGESVEYLLDKSGYNDFERNKTDTYTLTLNDPQFPASNIRNIWIRKSKVLGDDWKFHSITVNMKGSNVYTGTPNTWLTGNTTYNIAVNGFLY